MITINRTAIVGVPGQAFLDWLHRADPTSGGLSLEDLRREPMVNLLPECENQEEARGHLRISARRGFRGAVDWLAPCSLDVAGPA